MALYKRALAVLDPPHPVFGDTRTIIDGILKSLEPAPKPVPTAKKAAPKKK